MTNLEKTTQEDFERYIDQLQQRVKEELIKDLGLYNQMESLIKQYNEIKKNYELEFYFDSEKGMPMYSIKKR